MKMNPLNYDAYVPQGNPNKVTWHWTGGSYTPSSLDAEHYQFLIAYENGRAQTYLGKHSVRDQDSTSNGYAAHTASFNTKNIGISVCGMAGSREGGTFGNYPLTEAQIDEMVKLTAFLCRAYGLEPIEKQIASHCEIQRIHGAKQAGKWDISCLQSSDLTWKSLNDWFRYRVEETLAGGYGGQEPAPEPGKIEIRVPIGTEVIITEY